MGTVLSHVKRTITSFKHRYGLPIDYHIIDQHDVDPTTGDKTTVLAVHHVKKAVVMRTREFRSFVYDVAYMAANRDFTEGGYFDPEDRSIIVDAKDLGGHEPTVDDYIIFQNKRYDVSEVAEFEVDHMFAFNTRYIRGQEVTRMLSRHSGLVLTDVVTAAIVGLLDQNVVDNLSLTDEACEVP